MLDSLSSASASCVLEDAVVNRFGGRIALVSSFGTESAILLHMLAEIDINTPVIFLDTGKLFTETLTYRDELVARFGLTDVRAIRPSGAQLAAFDPDGRLWSRDPDLCCSIRKTNPLDDALEGFAAWITGRKRSQGGLRSQMQLVEPGPDGRMTVNPLAFWTDEQIERYFKDHRLPHHPLEAAGYTSLGCETCTSKAIPGQDKRAGRWVGSAKTECGIHLTRASAA